MTNQTKGLILVILSTITFGLMPVFIVFAYRSGIETNTLLLMRFIFSTVFFFFYVWRKYKRITVDRQSLIAFFILGGICYTFQSRFYFTSLRYISPALATLFLYSYPAAVTLLSSFVDREAITKKTFFSIVVSLFGILLIVGTSLGDVNLIGVFYATGAALIYSVYIVYSNRAIKNTPTMVASAYIALFSMAGTFIFGSFSGGFNFNFDASVWLPLIGLALISTVMAMTTFLKGMAYLGPTKTSIVSLLEAVFTVLFAVVFLNDFLTLSQLMGGVFVLLGAYLVVRPNKRETMPSE